MAATIDNVEWTWFIRRVSVKKNIDIFFDVITSATWSLEAEYIDTETREHYVKNYADTTSLDVPTEENYIEYSQINNNTVISWIESVEAERLNAIKQKLIDKINQECGEETNRTLIE